MRNIYDLDHYSAVAGNLGRLATISTIPVIANDTLEIDVNSAVRLSPLRTVLTLDCKVDYFVFYDKYRNSYGNDWVDMIKEGINGTSTLPTFNMGSNENKSCEFLSLGTGTAPKHYIRMYNNIWNNYFRIPNNTDELSEDYLPGTTYTSEAYDRLYGYRCARLPAVWNTGVDATRTDAENSMAVSTSGNTFDLIDIAQVRAQYKNEIDRDWFSHRYRDFMSDTFGSTGIHIDADQRPELLYHHEQYMSGYDIDGTSGNTFGNTVGKAATMVNFKVPPKYFNEHGMVWIMALLRFPSILQEEAHYLSQNTLDYETISGDPAVILNERPHAWSWGDVHKHSSSTGSLGEMPYGQWYRTQNNRVHRNFDDAITAGYPFIDTDELIGQGDGMYSIFYDGHFNQGKSGYHDYFSNQQLGHWNSMSSIGVEAKRIVPPASKSINAGL